MTTGLFITQARGIREEEPFIKTHRAYAARHGLDHRVVTDIPFPAWMVERYENPYKFGKSFILIEALKYAPYVMFAESDVMITNIDVAPPQPRYGSWLRSGTCRPSENEGPCICPCVMTMNSTEEASAFFAKSIELLESGFPDGFPFDEALFHETRRELGWPRWDMDSTLCSYHNADYRDSVTRPWFPGDFAMHVSGVAWPHKLNVFRSTAHGAHLLPGLSVIVACMDRNDRLAATLPSWLNSPGVDEVIVVDWSCATPLLETLSDLMLTSKKLHIIRVEGETQFNQGQAYNVGLRFATRDVTLKIDADYLLADPGFVGELKAQRSVGAFGQAFFTGHFIQSIPQLNGLVAGLTSAMQRVGYREDFQGWGYDDDDFYNRLQPGKRREMIRDLSAKVIHVPHGDAERTMRYAEQSPEQSWSANVLRSSSPAELPNRHYYGLQQKSPHVRMQLLRAVPPTTSRLLKGPDDYGMIFEPWRGKKVSLYANPAFCNVGDLLIIEATRQLFAYYGIKECALTEADVAMFTGGGNVGPLYPRVSNARAKFFRDARSRGIPTVLLPQSISGPDASIDLADTVFVRDTPSLELHPAATLAPDLALAWIGPVFVPEVVQDLGIFLRRDKESAQGEHTFADPATQRQTPVGYVSLASGFRRIETDRLHFAVAALLAGCEVTLLPNSYSKNFGVYEAWLREYDCAWAPRPSTNQTHHENEPSRSSCCACRCCTPAESEAPEARAV